VWKDFLASFCYTVFVEHSSKKRIILLVLAIVFGVLGYYIFNFYTSKTSPGAPVENSMISRLTAPSTASPIITPELRAALTAPKE